MGIKYASAPATTTVSTVSVAVITGLSGGDVVEISVTDADVWINVSGGTAAADGAGCIPVKSTDPAMAITVDQGVTQLTAIRDAGTDAHVTTAIVAA